MSTQKSLIKFPEEKPLSKEPLERLIQLRDPMMFLKHCCFTFDNADQRNPIKRFPWEKPYIFPLVRVWERSKLFAIPKSRRMVISWTMMALHFHYALININRLVGIFSKKEADADELLERAIFMYNNIPQDIWPPELRPKYRRVQNVIEFKETGSLMRAFPQGPDQARQHGFSRILFDEYAYWPDAAETYGATLPTLQGGGMLSIVSTYPKIFGGDDPHFYKILDDRLEDA